MRLRPNGANGYGSGGGGEQHAGAPELKGMWGVGDTDPKAGDKHAAAPPAELDLDTLRALFDKFDTEPKDGVLSQEEFGKLLCQMMPTRVSDFKELGVGNDKFSLKLKLDGGADMTLTISKQFEIADTDGSGGIDFDEFVA